jgi:t-SNARE complex subunit (syntaxin)
VVDEARNNAETKSITKLSNGDTVVIVQKTESLRDQLEQAIKQQGDHRLLFHARIWKRKLEQAIEEEGDDLDDFIEKCENVGLDRTRQTFRKWYNLDIGHTRAEDDMKKLAEAYDLTVVKENFEQIWAAANKIDVLHQRLLSELRERAYRAVTESMDEIVLDEEYDIRLSDFDTVDEHGNQLVQVLDVVGVEENVKVQRYRVNQLERISGEE